MRSALPIILLLALTFPGQVLGLGLGADQSRLLDLRARQREASRLAMANKSGPGPFALLVIPVDFADARLASDWNPSTELMPRLHDPSGPSLTHFYHLASGGNLDLQLTLTPVIHLAEERRQYSDVGYHGFTRTRKLARESLEGALAAGVELRRLDLQGADGQVDGVLILHAGVGQENDTLEGLIQPLQFFLEEPVEDDGIQATTYAVASLGSGLGIWAHETGHLLGMEDRYDPLLHPVAGGVDVRSLGGLGRFSLMSSGAWGTGGGHDPALPDAYNCAQLGWVTYADLPATDPQEVAIEPWRESGRVARIWTHGSPAGEFFLLETRDPAATAPYDAALEAHQLLITHVDESVPEAYILEDGPSAYHLRVRLVEADGDDLLRYGENDGASSDLFPGSLGVTAFTPGSTPSSQGYEGPSLVSLEDIRQDEGSVLLTARASDGPAVRLTGGVTRQATGAAVLSLGATSVGQSFGTLAASVSISGSGGGTFGDGSTATSGLFTEGSADQDLELAITLLPPANPQPGEETILQVVPVADGQTQPASLFRFVWEPRTGILDLQATDWELWEQEFPAGNMDTRWRHWRTAPFLSAAGTPVLACVGEAFDSSVDWPAVRYANQSRAVLISPPLDPAISLVRMTHAIEVEYLRPGVLMDGATVWWQDASGQRLQAHALAGDDGVIDAGSSNPLRGLAALGDSALVLDAQDRPEWRVDSFAVPEGRPGPWRLVLDFASNGLWAGRGWFIARIEGLPSGAVAGFDLQWAPNASDCSGLSWDWPQDQAPGSAFQIQAFDEEARQFTALPGITVGQSGCSRQYLVPADLLGQALVWDGNRRHGLRARAEAEVGAVVSRPVFVYPDGGPAPIRYLEDPFPNPSPTGVSFRVEWPGPGLASVGVYDLRGRLLHEQELAAGSQQLVWDGRGPDGRRAASGTYLLRLEGSGRIVTRKVVLLR